VTEKQSLSQNWFSSVTGFVYAIVIFARDWNALDRIAADTGYTYVPEAVRDNLWVLFKPLPEYFEVSGRAAAEVVAIFPIRYHAIASSTVVNFIWVGLGLLIYAIIFQETRSKIASSLAGLALIVTPHASESSIGNIGMIKFPLTAAIALAFCSSRAITKFPKLIAIVAIVGGLSQPILVVTSLPLLWQLRRGNKVLGLLLIVYGTLVVQIFKVGFSNAIEGRDGSSVKSLWPGMGLFWYSGIFVPTSFVVLIAILDSIKPFKFGKFVQIRLFIGISTFALAFTCYVMGGIADRYFVAPMTLASISGILFSIDFIRHFNRLRVFTIVVATIIVIVPVVKWFKAGWFLSSGPTWTSQVDQAKKFCVKNPNSKFELFVSPSSYTEVDCDVFVE